MMANNIADITAGDGRYIAVGQRGTIIVSDDAVHWRHRNVSIPDNLTAIAYGEGRFVVGGSNGRILSSVDGEEWFLSNLGANIAIWDVCFGSGKFVAAAAQGYRTNKLWVSADATNWTQIFQSVGAPRSMAYGNGRFVIVGSGSMVSMDATNWISNPAFSAYTIAYGNGRFLAISDAGGHRYLVSSSEDGLSWKAVQTFGPSAILGLTYGNDFFVATAQLGTILTTIDGLEFTLRAQNVSAPICYDGERFVGVSSTWGVWESSDGVRWRPKKQFRVSPFANLYALAAGAGTSVALWELPSTLRNKPSYLFSTNQSTWTSVATNPPLISYYPVYDAAFADGKFVGVSGAGAILLSTNGINWSNPSSGTTAWLRNVCFARGTFYVRPESGSMLVSGDGAAWSAAEFDAAFSRVADDGNRLVAVNGTTTVLVSTNGVIWSPNTVVNSKPLGAVAYGNRRFVAIGSQGALMVSTNGIAWSLGESGTVQNLNGITFAENVFVVVGNEGTILTSRDGIDWTAQDSRTRVELYNVVWTGTSFLVSGNSGLILQSDPLIATAPVIIQSPQPQDIQSGTELSLDVIASGSSPLNFQWSMNGAIFGMATNSYFYRRHVTPSDAGDYAVIVSNSVGSVTSAVAHVSIETNVNAPTLQVVRRSHAEIDIVGTPGIEHVLEFTSTLGDSNSWQTLHTFTPATVVTTIPDVRSTNVPLRFYRSLTR
jgi:hypothetical protein